VSKDQARELLGAGLQNVVVASAIGVSESQISQWLSEEQFREEVQKLRLQNLTSAAERDRKWNSLEDKLLERLDDILPTLVQPGVVIQALKAVNNAVRRAAPKDMGVTAQSTHLHLHMPALLAAKFVVNKDNQVVEVDGRSVATMPANAVVAKMNEAKERGELNVLPVANSDEVDIADAQVKLENLQRIDSLPIHQVI
jgi:hypothetical protein